eukprot:COSAG01_NODE_695_length_14201_cov_10.521875_6_plen_109_part_00
MLQNFFVQLHGRKRFFLLPPAAAVFLYTFPRLHPSYRQVQTDLAAPASFTALAQDFPRLHRLLESKRTLGKELDALEFVLEPGDVLYIPPYWFHLATVLPVRWLEVTA